MESYSNKKSPDVTAAAASASPAASSVARPLSPLAAIFEQEETCSSNPNQSLSPSPPMGSSPRFFASPSLPGSPYRSPSQSPLPSAQRSILSIVRPGSASAS